MLIATHTIRNQEDLKKMIKHRMAQEGVSAYLIQVSSGVSRSTISQWLSDHTKKTSQLRQISVMLTLFESLGLEMSVTEKRKAPALLFRSEA